MGAGFKEKIDLIFCQGFNRDHFIFLCSSNRFISLSDQLRAFLTVEALGDKKAARLYTVAGTKAKFFKTMSSIFFLDI